MAKPSGLFWGFLTEDTLESEIIKMLVKISRETSGQAFEINYNSGISYNKLQPYLEPN